MDDELLALSTELGRALTQKGWRLACAESCTGGWIAMVVTAIAGSSSWFDRGFVTYSNEAKQEMLEVPAETIRQHGAVSEQTVLAMAQGALNHSHAQVSLSVSGIAGPGGGTVDKPPGTVCFAWAISSTFLGEPGFSWSETQHFSGSREAVRRQAVQHALKSLLAWLCHN